VTAAAASSSVDLSPERLAPLLAGFLQTQWGRPVRISAFRRYPAGFSWITIGFIATTDAQTHDLILRVGDPHGLLAPYRAEPEYLALTALHGTADLPIPRAYAFCDDPAVIGAPFLVTGRVDGDTPMPWRGASDTRGEAHNASLGRDFTNALAAIHRVDWRATPLQRLWGDADARDVARHEVHRWAAHAGLLGEDRSHPRAPQLHYAVRWLERHAPVADRVTIVHGDFRVGNFLQVDGRITAILDWELIHAGDPHEDLAWAGLRVFSAGTSRIGGLMERDAFYARYTAGTGLRVRPEVVRYYEVLAQFKSAAMLVGAVRRIESGQARDIRMASMGFQMASTLLSLNRMITEAV